jgi:hypothetical protein
LIGSRGFGGCWLAFLRLGRRGTAEKLLMAKRALHLMTDPRIVKIEEFLAMRTG